MSVGGISGTAALSALCPTPKGPRVYVYESSGATDQPESGDNLAFLGARNATVTAGVNNLQDDSAPPP